MSSNNLVLSRYQCAELSQHRGVIMERNNHPLFVSPQKRGNSDKSVSLTRVKMLSLALFLLGLSLVSAFPGSWSSNSYAKWAGLTKNTDWSTGPLARPFARSLAPLTHSLATDCSLRSRPPLRSLVRSLAHFAHSLSRGKMNFLCLKMTWFCPIVHRRQRRPGAGAVKTRELGGERDSAFNFD